MRKVLIAIVVLPVVAVGALLVVPSFVDWNAHKGRVTAELAAATGRPVRIDGGLSLRILPTPTLTAAGVRLANLPGSETQDMVNLVAVEVRVALAPLFEGRIAVDSVILVEPTIVLERLADGRANWQFDVTAPPRQAVPRGGTTVAGLPFMVELNDVRIQDGTLIYQDATTGTVERIENINAVVVAASLAGPFRAKGEMQAGGMSLQAEFGLGRLVEDKAIPLSLVLGTAAGAGTAEFNGFLSGFPNKPRVTGKLKAGSHDLATTLPCHSGAAACSYLARPLELDGTVAASADAVALNDLTFRLGSITGTGVIDVALGQVPRANVILNIGQVDMDALRAAAAGQTPPGAGRGRPQRATAGGFALPTGMTAAFEIKADAVIHNATMVRQVKIAGELADGELTLNQASALLPGGSAVSMFGTVAARDGAPVFEGQVEASSDNFRGLLQWLDVDVSEVPPGRLRKFEAQASIKATPTDITVTDIDVQVDVSRLLGGVAIALRARPGFGIGLSLDKLDLGAYLSDGANGRPAAGGAGPPQAALRERLRALAALDRFDAILNLHAGSLSFAGVTARDVRLDGTLRGGALELREAAIGDLAGGRVAITGKITELGGDPAVDFDVSLEAPDPSALLRLVGLEPPLDLDATTLEARLEGDLDRLEFGAELDALGARVEAKGTVSALDTAPHYNLALSARHPSLAALTAALAGDGPGAGPSVPMRLDGTLVGGGSEAAVNLTLGMDEGTLALEGAVTGLDAVPAANLTLAVAHPDLVRLVQVFAPDFEPALAAAGGLKLDGRLGYDADGIALRDLAGTLGPVSVEGEASLALVAGVRPRLEARLAASELVLDWFLAAGATNGAGREATRWSREPIDLSILRAVDARLALSAPAVSYGPYRVEATEAELEIADGVFELRRLAGRAYGGEVTMTARLASRGVPEAGVTLRVEGADAAALTGASQGNGAGGMVGGILELLFPISGVEVVSGRLDADVTVSATGRNEFELISNLAGDGRVDFTDAVVTGVDVCGISEQLDNLRGIEGFLGLFAASSQGGETRVGDFTGHFTLERGVANLPQQRLEPECAAVEFSGAVDLPRWLINIEADVTLPAHADFPGIVVQENGPLSEPNIRIVNVDEIQQYLVGRAAQGALRKLVPDLVPRLAPPQPAPEAEPAEPKQPDPAERFLGILEGLIRP